MPRVADQPDRPSRPRAQSPPQTQGRSPTRPTSLSDRALALQRAAGNRNTARALTRWAADPDKTKKGVMVPDVVAADLLRFNPPKNQ
jgi:hypothetical protein